MQNPIPYCRGKVGEFALVHGLRAAHLSHGGIEQLSYLVEVPGGRARVSRKPVEFEQVRAAVARQRFGDEIRFQGVIGSRGSDLVPILLWFQ